jgi:hypothetical protein
MNYKDKHNLIDGDELKQFRAIKEEHAKIIKWQVAMTSIYWYFVF